MKTGKGVESHVVLHLAFKKKGNKFVAQEFKLSCSLVDKWARPGKNGCGEELNPLDRVELIIRLTEDLTPLHWLCARFDGYFVKNPPGGVPAADAGEAQREVVESVADFEKAMTGYLKRDGRTPENRQQLRRQGEQLKSTVEGFVQLCERGIFQCGALMCALDWLLALNAAPVVA